MLNCPGSKASIRQRNRERFAQLRFRGRSRQLLDAVRGSRHQLIALSEIEAGISVSGRHDAGVQLVSINQIRGSEGRCHDFDRHFRPLKEHNQERWASIATARETYETLPIIELIQVGDLFFVRDGHHRISVAKLLGQREMEAAVTVWTTESNGAEILAMVKDETHIGQAANRIKRKIQRILQTLHQAGRGFTAPSGQSAFQV